MRFENKVVFITGAGGYIGGETAYMFGQEGASVAVCDINQATVDKTVLRIQQAGGTAMGVVADVTNSASVDSAVARTVERFGRLDVMVHVAGGSARKKSHPLIEQTDDVIQEVIGINLFGAIYASRAAARAMVAQGQGGRIINFSSIVAENGLRGCVDYAAAKGGVILALSREQGLGVKFIGVGEQMDDLRPFDPASFAEALFPQDEAE